MGLAYRDRAGTIIEKPSAVLNNTSHEYEDISFHQEMLLSNKTEIFPPIYDLDLTQADRSLFLNINGQILRIPTVKLLFQLRMTG